MCLWPACVQKKKKVNSAAKSRLSRGGWDKCLGPFTESEATEYGVDVWKCRSYCYTRRDPNGGAVKNILIFIFFNLCKRERTSSTVDGL